MPKYREIMLPMLQVLKYSKERHIKEVIEVTGKCMQVTEEVLQATYPQSGALIFYDRGTWARTYLLKAGRIEAPMRGWVRITPRGLKQIEETPNGIAAKDLLDSKDYQKFYKGTGQRQSNQDEPVTDEDMPPQGRIEAAYQEIKQAIKADLLAQIMECSPTFFEGLVVDLLVGMGYGGDRKDAGRAVGQSGDGGIDGIIKEDKLGLDLIYLQAKRWKPGTSVGRPEIQMFSGALDGKKARKGVFITTSHFTKEAAEYAAGLDKKIILIDGDRLTDLMIEQELGLNVMNVYKLMRLDADYFNEEG